MRKDEMKQYGRGGIALCVFNYSHVITTHVTVNSQRLTQVEIDNFVFEFTRSNVALSLNFSITTALSSLETGAQKQTSALSRIF
jgi:hypothetical protein